ncbi:hypothetical protein [Sphingobacterium multivorum]|uniref:hypothetical protein n=1 Tax=Sphingobacterium multivorum TaxID=28454 RepID=UPI0011BFBEF3|nr:hypothetical protein [Sphingobacterium multivorum]
MRINLQSKVAKFLTVGTQTFGDMQNLSVADVVTAYSYLTQTVPGVYPYYNGGLWFSGCRRRIGNRKQCPSFSKWNGREEPG